MHQPGNESASTRVTQVTGSRSLATFSELQRVDHEDTWRVRMDGWPDRGAERCARIVLDEAPLATRVGLRTGWANIGLKLDSGANTILGWTIRRNTPEVVVLGLPSRVGMPGELIFRRDGPDLLFATLVQHRSRAASMLWRAILSVHVPIVRELLTVACSRLAVADEPDPLRAGRRATR
jgi:hypothetical protein